MHKLLLFLLIISCTACQDSPTKVKEEKETSPQPAAYSLAGKPLFAATPSEKLLTQYNKHKKNYETHSTADNLIWYGRFTAYQGKYEQAIELYTKGIQQFPEDARFYRHRGHRYISIRKFDLAIADFLKATELIQGQPNAVEPDGMPNAQNTPVSTLHGNIYYHLGLAYYLKHDFPNALDAYQKCLATSSNPDNVVSATHWLYMINRRMNQKEAADQVLANIQLDMPIIENHAYHQTTLLYKGLLDLDQLLVKDGTAAPSNDAIDYGIGNWYLYNGETAKAKAKFKELVNRDSWSSFGYIAAEKELMVMD